jgi:DDE domain
MWSREPSIWGRPGSQRAPRRLNATVPSGQIIDVYVSSRRDFLAARRFFAMTLRAHDLPIEVVTDPAPALRAAIEGLIPAAVHNTRAVREQPRRMRPWPAQVPAPPDARARTGPHRAGGHPRSRTHAEHPPQPLRTRRRCARTPDDREGVQRSRPHDLNPNRDGNAIRRDPIRVNATVPPQRGLRAAFSRNGIRLATKSFCGLAALGSLCAYVACRFTRVRFWLGMPD